MAAKKPQPPPERDESEWVNRPTSPPPPPKKTEDHRGSYLDVDTSALFAEIADLKRQLAKVESQRDFWYEACQEDELSKLNDEIDDLKRQLADSVQRQEALEAVVALDKQQLTALREQNAKLRDVVSRIRQWDSLDTEGDGPYWKRELESALRETSDESEAKHAND